MPKFTKKDWFYLADWLADQLTDVYTPKERAVIKSFIKDAKELVPQFYKGERKDAEANAE